MSWWSKSKHLAKEAMDRDRDTETRQLMGMAPGSLLVRVYRRKDDMHSEQSRLIDIGFTVKECLVSLENRSRSLLLLGNSSSVPVVDTVAVWTVTYQRSTFRAR